jgi:hypothetical protein
MKTDLFVLLGLLVFLVILYVLGVFTTNREGFETSSTGNQILQLFRAIPRCPPGFTFFNGPDGVSMCCKGKVNPYTHTCAPVIVNDEAEDEETMCAFSGSVPDPRAPNKVLPLCSSILMANFEKGSNYTCPPSLPFYAEEGAAKLCCKSNIVGTATGFRCAPADMADKGRYCVVQGSRSLKEGETFCEAVGLLETAECPTGFQRVEYTLGEREKVKKPMKVPVCFKPDQSCFPEKAIAFVQKQAGVFADKKADTWTYSCKTVEAKQKGMEVAGEVKTYP